MATPTLRALRQHYGSQARLVGVLRPYVAQVLEGSEWLDDQILFQPQAKDRNLRSWSVIRQLRRQRLDSIILLTNSLRSASMAWASGVPQRVGYVRYGRGPLLTERLDPPRQGLRLAPISAVDYYLHLAEAVGAMPVTRRVELATTLDDEQQADRVMRHLGWTREQPLVTLSTGGAYGAAKRWPDEHFAQLARQIVTAFDVRVVVICGPAEREAAARIERQAADPRVRSLAEQSLSIGLSKAMVRRSRLLIATDSGPRHFGAAFQVPTVTIFGPTDPRWSETYHPQALHVQRAVDCGPCARRTCPLQHHRCMRELNPEEVFRAAAGLLASPVRKQAA